MATSRAQVTVHRYVSGWCEAARHNRCQGSYAGAACCCSCHSQAAPGAGTARTATAPRIPGDCAGPVA